MKNIWYKSHGLRTFEFPLFEIIIFLEIVAGLLVAFVMTLLNVQQAFLALALANYLIYAYNGETIKILIKKMPLLYKCNKKAYLRYSAFVTTQKSDLLVLGASKTLFLLLFSFSDFRFLMFMTIDVLASIGVLLFLLLDTGLFGLSAKLLLIIVLITSYVALEMLDPVTLNFGFAALSLTFLIFCCGRVRQNRMAELIGRRNGKLLKNSTIGFLSKGIFDDFRKNIFSFVLLTGAGVLIHHFKLPVGVAGLFALLTFFEAIIYLQINLYEKGIGHSAVLFLSQRKMVFTGVFLGQFSYRCFSWTLALLFLVICGFVRSPLQIFGCALWFVLLLTYATTASEKIVVYREKRPKFIEQYAALALIVVMGALP